MTRILVVDDLKTDRLIVKKILESEEDLTIDEAADGASALEIIERSAPEMVLTDLMMPGMDGLQLVAAIRDRHPTIPVVLMTSQGSEEIAVRALKEGATNYVPKRSLKDSLKSTIRSVLDLAGRQRIEKQLFQTLRRSETEFRIENIQELVRPLVKYLQEITVVMGVCDDPGCMQVGVALCEALNNAIEHGNLEVSSELRAADLTAYMALLREREHEDPYRERRVVVEANVDRDEARFVIRDEGGGFDPGAVPDPLDPENLDKVSGRGIMLIRSFMDEVVFNDLGNEVTMVKRRMDPESSP